MNPLLFPSAPRKFPSIQRLGLPLEKWIGVIFFSAVGVLFFGLLNLRVGLWTGLGLVLTLVVFAHLGMTGDRCVAFPGLIAFAGCVQWIVAPWLSGFFPPSFPLFEMSIPLERYMSYVVPATAAFWLGLHWPVRREMRQPLTFPDMGEFSPGVRRALDGIILAGLFLSIFSRWIPSKFGFAGYVLASFRFFAALCWMLNGAKGWRLRVGIVFVFMFLQATAEGIFYQMIHWGGYFVLVYAFQRRWRWKLAMTLIAGVIGLGLLQAVKQEYRLFLQEEGEVRAVERFQKLGGLVKQRISRPYTSESEATVGDVLARFNQGWIIARIMDRVPRAIPFARGETIREAAIYTLVPRVLYPEKREGASKALFTQYTGLPLRPWTSMGLGVIGELYANFGVWGGVAATFVYGWVVGFLFSIFLRRSLKNIFWLAVASLVLLPVVEPGWNIEDVSNHIFKAGLIVFFLVWAVPWLRRFLALSSPWTIAQVTVDRAETPLAR